MVSGSIISWQKERGKSGSSDRFYFLGFQNEIKRHLLLGKKAMSNPDSVFKKQRLHFADTGSCSQSYDLSSSHVWM